MANKTVGPIQNKDLFPIIAYARNSKRRKRAPTIALYLQQPNMRTSLICGGVRREGNPSFQGGGPICCGKSTWAEHVAPEHTRHIDHVNNMWVYKHDTREKRWNLYSLWGTMFIVAPKRARHWTLLPTPVAWWTSNWDDPQTEMNIFDGRPHDGQFVNLTTFSLERLNMLVFSAVVVHPEATVRMFFAKVL